MWRERWKTVRNAAGSRRTLLWPAASGAMGFAASALAHYGGSLTGMDTFLPALFGYALAVSLLFWWVVNYATLLRRKPRRDKSLYDAIFYLVRKRWNERDELLFEKASDGDSHQDHKQKIMEQRDYQLAANALIALQQAAYDGTIMMWGKNGKNSDVTILLDVRPDALFSPIAREHWSDGYRVDPEELIYFPKDKLRTFKDKFLTDDSKICLMVCEKQIEEFERRWSEAI